MYTYYLLLNIVSQGAATMTQHGCTRAHADVTAVTRVRVTVAGVGGWGAAAPGCRGRWAVKVVVGRDLAKIAETLDSLREVQRRQHATTAICC